METPVVLYEGSTPPGNLDLPPKQSANDALWTWLEDAALESSRVRNQEANFLEFNDYLDIFYGKHWPGSMPSFRPPIVANELRTLILSEASDLSESQFRVYITKDPRKGGRDEAAERAFQAVWRKNQVDLQLTLASLWSLVAGTGFICCGWDPELFHGMGDIIVFSRDPRTVLPDPDAIDDLRWQFVITETFLDLAEIRRIFPVTGMQVTPEEKWSVKDASVRVEGSQTAAYQGPLYPGGGMEGRIPGYKKARARVLECIMKDDTVETVYEEETGTDGKPATDPKTGLPRYRQVRRFKYPHGRRIVGANGVILFDGDSPNPKGDFGILRVVLEPTLDRFWSKGFIQQTSQLQLAANKLLSAVVENAIRLNNGMYVATGNTGLDLETFAGIPGQMIQISPNSNFDIKYPPPMPPDMIQAPWRILDMQRRLLGFRDSRVGEPSRGNVSAELTETEISQAQSTTRLRARMLYAVVQRLSEMILARMVRGYMTTRQIPAVDKEEFKPVQWVPVDNPDDYSVYVDPASFNVMSKTLIRRVGMMLYKLRAIDRESLLDTIGWPDASKVAQRIQKSEQLQAWAEANKKK